MKGRLGLPTVLSIDYNQYSTEGDSRANTWHAEH